MPICLDNLTVGYDRHPAVHHLSGRFEDGSMTAIIGPNGAGKSTLLKALMGFVRPMSGRIDYGAFTMNDIAYVAQASDQDRSFPFDVMDVVVQGHWPRRGAFSAHTAEDQSKAHDALKEVGLASFEHRPISTLSVGQWKRVLFARALVQSARVMLLDEPLASIDEETSHDLLTMMKGWHKAGRTVIVVAHDVGQIRQHFPEALLLAREALAWGTTGQVLTPEQLQKASRLARSWSEIGEACDWMDDHHHD